MQEIALERITVVTGYDPSIRVTKSRRRLTIVRTENDTYKYARTRTNLSLIRVLRSLMVLREIYLEARFTRIHVRKDHAMWLPWL